MATNKLTTTKAMKEESLQRIAKLDRAGYGQSEIAKELGVTQPQISFHLKTIRKRYAESTIANRSALVIEQVARLTDIYNAAHRAYLRSEEDKVKRTTTKGLRAGKVSVVRGKNKRGNPKFVKVSEEEVIEGRLPANEYLRTMIECAKEISKLHGLYPEEVGPVNNVLVLPPGFWETLQGKGNDTPADLIEQQIEKVRALPAPPRGEDSREEPGTNGVYDRE